MNGSRVPWWGDLTAVVGLALAGLVFALVPVPAAVRTAAVLPLLLVLPGYAVTAALFRPGEISRQLRAVLSVAFSISASVLGAVVVQLFIPLDRPVWAATLVGITSLAAAIALDRRDAMPADSEETRVRLPRIGVVALAAMLVATGIAGWAIALATEGVHRQLDAAHFSALWLVPGESSPTVDPVKVGVSNHEGEAAPYAVSVRQGNRTIRRWDVYLEPNQTWQGQIAPTAISGTAPLIALLERSGKPYHRVSLPIAGGG
jgi:uncharacterized membrane protein